LFHCCCCLVLAAWNPQAPIRKLNSRGLAGGWLCPLPSLPTAVDVVRAKSSAVAEVTTDRLV
jgi:hypothetical protein